MADNQEKVVYQYTGDISSLRRATDAALGLLDRYQSQIDRISTDGGFGKSVKAAKSFQSQINATTKQIASMQKKMKDVSDVRLYPSNEVTQQLSGSLGSIESVLDKLSSSSKLSTKEVQALTSQLRGANQSLKSNSAGVEALIQKEVKWQATLDNVRNKTVQFRDSIDSLSSKTAGTLGSFAHKVTDLGDRIASAFDPLTRKLNGLSTPFSKMQSRLQSFKDKASETFGRVTQLANTVSSAFRRVNSAEGDSADAATRSTTAHSRLRSVLDSIRNSFKRETTAIDKEQNSLKTKNDTLTESTRRHTSLRSVIVALGRMFSSESNSIRTFNTNLIAVSSTAKLAKNAIASLTGMKLGQWLATAAKQSIDFTENVNLFTVAMGDSLDVGTKFITQMQEIYGMDPSDLMRYAGNFYQLADAIDMPDESAAKLSLSLLKATNDISSLFNVPIEDVFNDLSSGMQGMSRAVRKYGMDIRVTTLEQTALSLGITDNVETMSEANRQGLRFITMMRQAANASGDFARTLESPANQLKIFKEQMTQLGRAIGDLFIKPLGTAIQYINGFVMALRIAITYISSLLGLVDSTVSSLDTDATDDASDSISGIGDSAADAAKKVKNLLGPFDELNVLSDKSSSGGDDVEESGILDPAIEEAIANMELELENVRMKANEVRDAILEFLGFTSENGVILSWDTTAFEENLINKFPAWTSTIQAVFANWSSIVEGFKAVFGSLGDVAQAVWDRLSSLFTELGIDKAVADVISGLADSLGKLASFISEHSESIADFVLVIAGLVTTFKTFSAISSAVTPVIQTITRLSTAFAGLGSTIAIIAAVVAAVVLLYKNSESFAASFNNLFKALWNGCGEILQSLGDALMRIGESLSRTWSEHIQPFVEALGNALAPILDTVTSLWGNLVSIITTTFETIATLWVNVVEPVLGAFFDALKGIAEAVEQVWTDAIGPIVQAVGDAVEEVWNEHLLPVLETVIEIIGAIIEIILALWNNVLAPISNYLSSIFAPLTKDIFLSIWNVVSVVIGDLVDLLGGLLEILGGVLEFLAGVFTGDWKRAWEGIVQIFSGVWNSLVALFKAPLNVVIGFINVFLSAITGAINTVVRAINKIRINVPDWVPGVGGKTIGFNINTVSSWQVPYLASGGVVTGPTMAMIGEGRHDEAVIPLGNSPQMNEFADNIVSKMGNSEQVALLREQNDLLRQILDKTGVNLDGRSITNIVSRHQRDKARAVGGTV